ncbi:hypothetical protein BV25DRAFT_1027771 [Artomyces pyxidatus]|uniref:Uncharacterized protein n=1 Tax=Artomyces pyxidatus TaxID=48021 RepID=A0ACB8SV93_9AGAM|nr:hypothetical protein BV25DRAFT_1027771 [Artomyces pyxidatus]
MQTTIDLAIGWSRSALSSQGFPLEPAGGKKRDSCTYAQHTLCALSRAGLPSVSSSRRSYLDLRGRFGSASRHVTANRSIFDEARLSREPFSSLPAETPYFCRLRRSHGLTYRTRREPRFIRTRQRGTPRMCRPERGIGTRTVLCSLPRLPSPHEHPRGLGGPVRREEHSKLDVPMICVLGGRIQACSLRRARSAGLISCGHPSE